MRDLQLTYVLGGPELCLLRRPPAGLQFRPGFHGDSDICQGICYPCAVPPDISGGRSRTGTAAAPDLQIIKKLWPNAWKLGVLSIGAFCIANGSVLICGQLLSTEITGAFGLTAQLGGFMIGFASLWLVVKWPQIAILRTLDGWKKWPCYSPDD